MSIQFQTPDANERFRQRREAARRARKRRRAAALALLLAGAAAVALGARSMGGSPSATPAATAKPAAPKKAAIPTPVPRALPDEMRGVHVTMALASLPGKLDEYLALQSEGLNTIQLDVKDENGEIGFVPSAVPLARAIGAARPYYKPRQAVAKIKARGLYLIGRVVVFEDPVLSSQRPDMAVRRSDGSVWRNHAGLGWTNPYDKRVWDYNVSIAEVAARMGFDEIQFDYVRFPSDGPVEDMVFPRKTKTPKTWVIPQFVHYASKRLKPLGVRVSVDVFGLSATRDLGIGQIPRRIAKYVDVMYPMVYPSHFSPGEYNIVDPNASPGPTISYSMADFRKAVKGTDVVLVPWLQDFSLGRTYTIEEVREQIDAARVAGAKGYLLWNPLGLYTPGALAPDN